MADLAAGNRTVVLPLNTAPLATPQLVGTLLNWGLFGVLSVQVYLFHLAFPKDGRITKALVYGVYILDMIQTILVTHDAYTYFAKGFGDLESLGQAHLEWLAVPTISGIVSCTVQMYYAYRVTILSGSRWLGLGICLIALMQGSAAIAEGAKFFIIGEFADLTAKTFLSCSIWLAGSAICDIIIAACMTFLLLRRDTKMPATHALVTKLVQLIVETGMLTALTATIDLILFMVFPHTAYHAAVALTLAKLYSNSMLVILNSRIRIVGGRTGSTPGDSYGIDVNSTGFRGAPKFATRRTELSTLGGVHVQESTWIETDSIPMEEPRNVYGSAKAHGLVGEV